MRARTLLLALVAALVVRDLWQQRDLGTIDRQFTVRVPVHGAVMFRVRKS